MTTRREFIKVIGTATGALMLGVGVTRAQQFNPNAWLVIERDGTIRVKVGKSEMGQGVRTSLPMIVAEELDADFANVRIEQASPGANFKSLGTGGSGSIMGSWNPLRKAGAAARAMLVAAAATKWSASADALTTSGGFVIHPDGRRLSYGELASDAASQQPPANPRLKKRSEYRLVGTAQKRLDGQDIVTGRARYGLDVRVPGMKFAVIARAPQNGSKVASFDATKAKAVAGVRDVFEVPTGVAVVADHTWAAIRGREALSIKWSESPNAAWNSEEHKNVLTKAIDKPALTIRKDNNGIAGFETASRVIEATYLYPFAAHASVEPVNCTALVADDRCTIWSPTQTPNGVQAAAARLTNLPDTAVTVNVTLLGGGFGRRLGVDFDSEAIEVAKRMKNTPVQLVWTREDDMKYGYFQAASAHHLRAALDASGEVVAWEHRKASTPHNARRVPTKDDRVNPETVRGWAWGVYDSPYFVKDSEMSYAVVDAPVLIGPWRSVFSPASVFARECFVDEIARETGRDPIALRYALLKGDETYTIGGETINRTRMRRVLETVAQRSGWGTPPPAGVARGIACNVFHTETYIAYVVDVRLRKERVADRLPFIVDRVVCAIDCGLVVNPLGVAQQVESGVIWSLSNMKNEITVKNGAVEQSYYSDFPVVMIDEAPAVIETHIVESNDDEPHGIGEPVVCPLAPAVASALSRLTGKAVRELPVRL